MARPPINYTSRDFTSIKNDLVNYAKRYYPNTFQDFNDASFGALMLDLVAYVGDQLSFYADYQTNETFLDTALEAKNVIGIAKQLGYKFPGTARSTGTAVFYVEVPVDSVTLGPDTRYIPILQAGSVVSSRGGSVYTLLESVNFADSSNEVTVSKVDTTNGTPLNFAIKAYGKIVSGRQYTETVTIGDFIRFRKIKLNRLNISNIVSVVDQQGNDYYEVDYLSQDVVYKQISNYNEHRVTVPYKIKAIPAPRRFTVEYNLAGEATLQFGFGSSKNLTTDVIADPADVVLEVTGRDYISTATFDPSRLNETDKFGVAPANTVLTVVYSSSPDGAVNAPVGAIDTIVESSMVFEDDSLLDRSLSRAVVSSLEVGNEAPIIGESAALSLQEVKSRAYGSYAAQDRAVSRSDYINLSYRMPAQFGSIKRVNIVQDNDSFKRNLNMYVLSDLNGNFVVPNSTLKNNLKQWLEPRRMLNDSIDILDGRIINIGIRFEVLADLDTNRFTLVDRCIEEIKNKYLRTKPNIGEALYISDIYKILNDVPGVTDTTNVEFVNKVGGVYSNNVYNIRSNLSDDGRFLIIPEDAVAEVLLPNNDIVGVVK